MLWLALIAIMLLIRWFAVQLVVAVITLKIENPCQGERR